PPALALPLSSCAQRLVVLLSSLQRLTLRRSIGYCCQKSGGWSVCVCVCVCGMVCVCVCVCVRVCLKWNKCQAISPPNTTKTNLSLDTPMCVLSYHACVCACVCGWGWGCGWLGSGG